MFCPPQNRMTIETPIVRNSVQRCVMVGSGGGGCWSSPQMLRRYGASACRPQRPGAPQLQPRHGRPALADRTSTRKAQATQPKRAPSRPTAVRAVRRLPRPAHRGHFVEHGRPAATDSTPNRASGPCSANLLTQHERAQATPASQSQSGAAVALAQRDGRGAVPFSASSRRWISISSSRYR